MKRPLTNTVKNDIREHIDSEFSDARYNVSHITDILDKEKESLRDVWWTVRNSVCFPTRASIIQKLK